MKSSPPQQDAVAEARTASTIPQSYPATCVLCILYIIAGTYAADCICDDPNNCNGVSLDANNTRRCSAFHRRSSIYEIRVSGKYIHSEWIPHGNTLLTKQSVQYALCVF